MKEKMPKTAPKLLLIRHAPTDWNQRRLYQGRTDIPLTPEIQKELQSLRVLEKFAKWNLYSSPLMRARQTATAIFHREPVLVSEAVERHYGELEGQVIPVASTEMSKENQYGWLGLDHRPRGGESMREVQLRMAMFLQRFSEDGQDGILVTHKGVIQALLAQALNWEMNSKRPFKADYSKGQLLEIRDGGIPHLLALNEEHSSK
jgi:probable phosphoglycerate mutase